MIYLFFFGFFVPVGCIVVCYIGILIVVYQHEKEMKKTLGGIRRQNVSQQRDKKLDTKTAKIIFTLIMLFLISWSPYAMVTLLAQFGSDKFRVTPWMSSLPALFAKSSTIYNPIIYGISHPIFRKGLKRFLTGDERRLSRRGTSSRRVTSLRMSEYRLNKEPMHTTTKCHSQKY